MKTSTKIDATPREEWKGKFCVMRETEAKKNMKFSQLHTDILTATEEAERMNSEKPEVRYMVVKVVAVIGY